MDDYAARARREVAIARARDAVTQLGTSGISLRVAGTDLFVMAGGDLPTDHVLCDAQGLPIPEVPGSQNHDPRRASEHARRHRAGEELVYLSSSSIDMPIDASNCSMTRATVLENPAAKARSSEGSTSTPRACRPH